MSERSRRLALFESRRMDHNSMDPQSREFVKGVSMDLPWIIGKSHSCHKLLDELNSICLNRMRESFKVYSGRYLLMRVVSEVDIFICPGFIAEDVNGDVEEVCLYNFDPTLENYKLVKRGTILLIKEPFLRLTNMSRDRFIRVDSPSDVIFIGQWDKALLEKYGALCWYKPEKMTFDQLKMLGNDKFVNKEYEDALLFYDRAMAMAQSEDQSKIIHLNRAAALLVLERFHEVNEAATKALGTNFKAFYRLGKAAYGMRNWEKALEWFEALVAKCSEMGDANGKENAIGELEKTKKRLAESKTGKYNQWKLFGFSENGKERKQQEKFYDMADYTGPVKIAKIPGKGMGLVVTENVEKGRLLIASKAYSMVYSKKGMNFEGEKENMKLTIQCVMETIQKLHRNPQSAEELYALYAGTNVDREKDKIPADVIDAERIEFIVEQNAFSTQDYIFNGIHFEIPGTEGGQELARRAGIYQACNGFGFWLLPSYINHACIANSMRYFCGDLMFIYALCDLKCGEEVTITYFDPFQSLAQREGEYRHREFECNCELCELERTDLNGKRRCTLLDRIQTEIGEVPSLIHFGQNEKAVALLQLHVRQLRSTYSGGEKSILRFHLLPAILRLAFVLEHAGELAQAAGLLRELLDEIGPQISTLRFHHLPVIHSHLAKIYACSSELGGLDAAKRVAEDAFELFGVKTGVKEQKLFGKMFPEFAQFLA